MPEDICLCTQRSEIFKYPRLEVCHQVIVLNEVIILLHVHPLLGNGLVNKFPRRQILGKQSVARLRNNSDNGRNAFNVVRAMPSAKQQNCKHVYNNRYFLWIRAEGS
jgi:hypothetical protein